MSLGRFNFDEISEHDLATLIKNGEGILVDYKREAYGNSDAQKKEFLKDVSSFANTAGGHLIIGMDEMNGVASGIVPLKELDPDRELQRLESLMRDGLEPRVSGACVKAVPITVGGFVIVIRIPRGWNPPYRVSAYGTNRFYLRNSAGAHEASVEELRILFNAGATTYDRVRAFRRERLAKVSVGETPISLGAAREKVLLHIAPLSAFSLQDHVDLRDAMAEIDSLALLGTAKLSSCYNFYGVVNKSTDTPCNMYTQLFRNGCIEAVKVENKENAGDDIPINGGELVYNVVNTLQRCIDILNRLRVSPPFMVMLTLDGVQGRYLADGPRGNTYRKVRIEQSCLELPEVVIDDFGTAYDYQRAICPTFDALWNVVDEPYSPHFDNDGKWSKEPKRRS